MMVKTYTGTTDEGNRNTKIGEIITFGNERKEENRRDIAVEKERYS